jgi:alpha-amylase
MNSLLSRSQSRRGPSVVLYGQIHQPSRLRRYNVYDIGNRSNYFDDTLDREVFRKVARKSYRPGLALVQKLVEQHGGAFRMALSVSGSALEQMEKWAPDLIARLRALAATGCVEFLAETYHHSLAFVFDRDEFDCQLDRHVAAVERLLGTTPVTFRNTELIYSDDVAAHVASRGFATILAEGADHVLDWKLPGYVYQAASDRYARVLLRHSRLSDDIAFRFSNRSWPGWPLTASRYAEWLSTAGGSDQMIGLFLDFESFGEHQWAETGIFEFLADLPREALARGVSFLTPDEAALYLPCIGELSVPEYTSWADCERDLSAWLGNPMQQTAAKAIYDLGAAVRASSDEQLLDDWRRLTTSDLLYYLSTKHGPDGDVHRYFSPYSSQADVYIALLNVLNDVAIRLGAGSEQRKAA